MESIKHIEKTEAQGQEAQFYYKKEIGNIENNRISYIKIYSIN